MNRRGSLPSRGSAKDFQVPWRKTPTDAAHFSRRKGCPERGWPYTLRPQDSASSKRTPGQPSLAGPLPDPLQRDLSQGGGAIPRPPRDPPAPDGLQRAFPSGRLGGIPFLLPASGTLPVRHREHRDAIPSGNPHGLVIEFEWARGVCGHCDSRTGPHAAGLPEPPDSTRAVVRSCAPIKSGPACPRKLHPLDCLAKRWSWPPPGRHAGEGRSGIVRSSCRGSRPH